MLVGRVHDGLITLHQKGLFDEAATFGGGYRGEGMGEARRNASVIGPTTGPIEMQLRAREFAEMAF